MIPRDTQLKRTPVGKRDGAFVVRSIVLLGALGWLACGEIQAPSEGSRLGSEQGASSARDDDDAELAPVAVPRRGQSVAGADAGQSAGGGSRPTAPAAEPDAGSAEAAGPPREYCDAITEVFQYKCGPSCHLNAGFKSGDFALGMDEARKYINRVSARGEHCGILIDPNNPSRSLILTKITGDYPIGENCGQPMPVGSIEITDDEIACVADWLEQFGD